MQAFQDWAYTGNMAFLAVGVLLSTLLMWWKHGFRSAFVVLSSAIFSTGVGLFVAHLYYIVLHMPLYLAKRYIFVPLGFVPAGFIVGYILSAIFVGVVLLFISQKDAICVVSSSIIHLSAFLQVPYSYGLVPLLLIFFALKSKLFHMLGYITFLGAIVLYNIKWRPLSGLLLNVTLTVMIVSILMGMYITYRGEMSGV
ncbi:MAG TPA: hypothetical protein EYP16_00385 [Candidatus Atribacteria bacterium]|nr:hypothetical protein [Candidatus Atribacteria bacterium]